MTCLKQVHRRDSVTRHDPVASLLAHDQSIVVGRGAVVEENSSSYKDDSQSVSGARDTNTPRDTQDTSGTVRAASSVRAMHNCV